MADFRIDPSDRAVANSHGTEQNSWQDDDYDNQDAEMAMSRNARQQASLRADPRKNHGRTRASARKQDRKQASGMVSGWLRRSIYWSFVLGIWGTIAIVCVVAFYAAKLPQTTTWKVPDRPPNLKIVAADGQLLANRGATGGESVSLNDMSPYIPLAVIAIEDRRFKDHFGFDPMGFARAMFINLSSGQMVQGGSTLTQQLAKNLFLEPERALERKIQELVLAVWLETKFSKDEILEMYLNRVYFGSGATGVEAASRRYFNKSARDVNLAQAAILAGVLKAPSRLSPAKDPQAAEERAQVVLSAMRREGFISDRDMASALSMPATKAKRYWSGPEQYVADLVMKELPGVLKDIKNDVVIDTTIDLELQKRAGSIIDDEIGIYGKKRNISQGALVSIDGTGAIRALVGGREYADSQYDRATEAKRQPGSAFKPFVYLAALEANRTPQSMRQDMLVKIGNWQPTNYTNKYRGPVTLDTALTHSINTVAAQLAMEVGPKRVIETAKRLGIDSELQRNASISLGTSEVNLLELTTAYAPFANGGYRVKPYVIKRIKSATGEVLYERPTVEDPQVVAPRELGMMNYMLKHVVSEGTGTKAAIEGWEIAGKTGTTQNFRDALFVGYTANLITGVWYGNDDGSSMKKVTGGSMPAESFAKFMKIAHEGVPVMALPGQYVPEAEAPAAVLSEGGTDQVNPDATASIAPVDLQPAGQNASLGNGRRSLSQIQAENGGGLVPPGSIGGQNKPRQKPKTIIDLLFGG